MKFTLSWLNEYLETKESLADIMHHLTMLGIEVESFEDPSVELAPFLIGQIKHINKHPNADRLNICDVQILPNADPPLVQVVCGAPNVYVGMKTVFAHIGTYIPGLNTTLKSCNIRGIDSNGMLCSLSELGLGPDSGGIIDLPDDSPVGYPFARTFGHDDPVVEVNVTPNRGDCLGVMGIAKDLAAGGFGKYINPKFPNIQGRYKAPYTINIDIPEDCPVYMGRLIKNVHNKESPAWLQQRLRKIGLEPISAIVDITNYINYDLCRPLHAFDADKLNGVINIRRAVEGEVILSLSDKEYVLSNQHLVIADEKQVLALAGVLGGKHSSTTLDTANVFLESAIFDPKIISQAGRDLNIHTDSRMRFERGIDPKSVTFGLQKATQMILDICGGEPSEIIVNGEVPDNEKMIRFSVEKLGLLTGISLSHKTIEKYLSSLGFKNIQRVTGEIFRATTPSWRFDIHQEEDVIEELLRLHNYDNLIETPLDMSPGFKPYSFSQSVPLQAKKILATLGFNESIHYTFTQEKIANLFSQNQSIIQLMNPISQHFSHMRPSVILSLLETVQRNLAYHCRDMALFEVGAAYHYDQEPKQENVASAILTGQTQFPDWRKLNRQYDVFDIKRFAFDLMAQLGINVETLQIDTDGVPTWYHPGQSAVLKLGPKLILGYLGRIHPKIEKTFEIEHPVYGFEIFLDRLPLKPKKNPTYMPNLLQPAERDFCFLMDLHVNAEKLLKAVESADKQHIKTVRLFDVYMGKGIPEGKKSVAFNVIFVPIDKTFTDDQLQALSQKVITSVTKATGGELRGTF